MHSVKKTAFLKCKTKIREASSFLWQRCKCLSSGSVFQHLDSIKFSHTFWSQVDIYMCVLFIYIHMHICIKSIPQCMISYQGFNRSSFSKDLEHSIKHNWHYANPQNTVTFPCSESRSTVGNMMICFLMCKPEMNTANTCAHISQIISVFSFV